MVNIFSFVGSKDTVTQLCHRGARAAIEDTHVTV